MKKVIALILAILMTFSMLALAGCDKGETKRADRTTTSRTTAADETTTTAVAGDVTTTTQTGGTTLVNGLEVVDRYIDENSHLWLVLSDGSKIDAGYVGTEGTDKPTSTTQTTANTQQTTTKKPTTTTTKNSGSTPQNGVINEKRTVTVYSYDVDEYDYTVGAKQSREITYKGTIKIGNTAATTGIFTTVGVPFNVGLEAYLNEINFNGGIGGSYKDGKQGYYIEFLHYDDGFDSAVGASYTKKLVEEDEVFALVGHFGSPVVGSTIKYIKQKGVIACYFASGSSDLSHTGATSASKGSTIFPVQPIYSTEGRIIVGRIVQQYSEARKIGVIYTDNETGYGIKEGAQAQIEALGSNYTCVLSQTSTDAYSYTSAVNKVADCDVIIVAAIQKGVVAIINSMIANGIYKPVFTSYSVAAAQTLLDIKPYYDSLADENKFPIYANAWQSSSDIESYLDFAVVILAYTGENTLVNNSYSMAGWIAASIFCEGLNRVIDSGKEITTANYVKAMESKKVVLPMGTGGGVSSTLDYSGGYRLGTTTMSLLVCNSACNSFNEAAGMKNFLNFIKTGDVKYAK